MNEKKHILWSSDDIDAYLDMAKQEFSDATEEAQISLAHSAHQGDLEDVRFNLCVQLSQPILVVGDLGLWNGRHMGYKEISSGNICDCLHSDAGYATW